ncbi:MAG: RNA methyltransferase [Acidimicrobiales bacterium]|nr:RNA methyltransferase [Acidimicrobiales bacterium]
MRQLVRKRGLRSSEGSLVVEGAELLSVAMDAGAPIEAAYVAPGGRSNPAVAGVVDRAFAAGVRVFDLAPGVIERIADTVTPQPLVAVVGFVPAGLESTRDAAMVVVLVDVRDPGNAGTMIRTADAAGVDAVICCDGTVDPTNPKTVRASAGSLFHLPVVAGGDPGSVVGTLRSWGFTTVGTAVRGGVDYAAFDWRRRVALVFGNEASGLDPVALDNLDERVSVPMAGGAESLNVSVSAAVLCFEALRQRRPGAGGARRSTMPGMEAATPVPAEQAGGGSDGGPR